MPNTDNAIVEPMTVPQRTITEVVMNRQSVLLILSCGHVAYWAGAASQWPRVGQVEQCLTCLTEQGDE